VASARALIRGERPGIGGYLAFGGPAVIASIAYMDPGNFATNIQAGAKYGYSLLWVVLLANLIAMLFQALSAKLGIVTGRNLAEMCRDRFPKPIVWAMWGVSEIAAMATDLAEFLGGAVGLSLLFNMPLLAGMVVTAIVTYGILMVENRGFRPVELIIGSFVAIIALCYFVEIFIAHVDWAAAALGTVMPKIADAGALLLAVGVGVTGIWIVDAKHETRQLFAELQELKREEDRLQIDWGRLQLEQSTYATHARIEALARERLELDAPDDSQVKIVEEPGT
jgi:manganese transport protein